MPKWMAVAALVAAMALTTVAKAADKVVLQLHGPAQFEFAGYYAALWQGYYNAAGLNVEIKPGAARGQQGIDPIREVTEGRAQFGTGGGELVVRAAQGLPLLLVAPIFQQSGAAVYYRGDSDFPSPASLVPAGSSPAPKIGRLPASDILDIELATALKAEGIDPAKLKSVSLDPGQQIAALSDRSVDAAVGSAWDLPYLARGKNLALRSFNPSDYRVEFYGDTLFALRRLAKAEPETVRKFREASLKGWDYALQHSDEIVTKMAAELPAPAGVTDVAALDRYQAEVARRLSRYPEVMLGHSNPNRWDRMQASMVAAGATVRTAETDDFVYDPDADARRKTDFRAFAIIGGTVAIGLAVVLWLWFTWGRKAAPAAAGGAPAVRRRSEPAPASPVTSAPAKTIAADLNLMIARLERSIRQRLPRQVSFRTSLVADLWECRADPQLLRRLVLDLSAEAVGQLRDKGELIIGTRNITFDAASLAETPGAQLGAYARITVRDNGSGFTEDALDRMLDLTSSPRPMAAGAVDALRPLGGFVRVESAEGIGTAVHLYLPRAAGAGAEPRNKPIEAVA